MADTFTEGMNLYRMRNYKDALTVFLSMPHDTSVPSLDIAYYIGLCYARLKRYDEALLYLEQVVTAEQDPSRVCQCRLTLAVIYSKTDRSRLARYELEKLVEEGYQTVQTLNALAYTSWIEGKQSEAIDYYRKALDIDEENPTALNGMGYCLACMNQELTKALFYCKKALDTNPDSAAYLDSLAWVYFKMGLQKEALSFARRAREKDITSKEIEEHLAAISENAIEL